MCVFFWGGAAPCGESVPSALTRNTFPLITAQSLKMLQNDILYGQGRQIDISGFLVQRQKSDVHTFQTSLSLCKKKKKKS